MEAKDVSNLEVKIGSLQKVVENHQHVLTQDDSKKRETNLIVTGVLEDTDEDDMLKVQRILEVAECSDVVPLKVIRVGRPQEERVNQRRPTPCSYPLCNREKESTQ